ncbi:Caffeoylshikimate esterase [Spatholobus suberectus]|nr:Caffeoylshikimate esterase [Spatholobus suberectus]
MAMAMGNEGMVLKGKEASALILTSGASGRIRALFSLRALRALLAFFNAVVLLFLLPFRKGTLLSSRLAWKSGAASTWTSRRALAIRRVLEDADGDKSTLREYRLFPTSRSDTIFTQSWIPLSPNINSRGVVVLMHGLNEHSGRYTYFAKQLNANGFKVYGMDWVGHGGSDGLHAYVHSIDDAVSDMKMFLEKVLNENPGLPCFCFGHSTGAAITLKALLDPKVEARIAGAILTSPAVGVAPSHPILLVLAPIASFLLPTYQCNSAYKKGLPVSRDPEALIAKYSDPLVCTGPLRVRTGYEILRITSYLQQNLRKFRVPFFVLHGTADSVTDPVASQKLHGEASSTDKTIKLYDGFLHDLLFEPERDAITQDIIQWMNCRV